MNIIFEKWRRIALKCSYSLRPLKSLPYAAAAKAHNYVDDMRESKVLVVSYLH